MMVIGNLPDSPGIYQFYDKDHTLLYVGKSISIKKRVRSYFSEKSLGPKTTLLVKRITDIGFIKVFSEFEALLLEAELIKKRKPFFNSQAKDDKSPLYIKVTNDPIPQVQTVRRQTAKRGIFIKGPFPSTRTTRDVLSTLRRIFPYCHHKNPKKPCLYVHLGLCPYPWTGPDSQKDYLANIDHIKKLLCGKTKPLIRDMTQKMTNFAKHQEYEKADAIKKQIEKIQFITTTYHAPREFMEQPTLVDDIRRQKLESLSATLEINKTPQRIECYDISNTSGKLATGSMVVFENGQSAKDQYRRFKIKFTDTPNDYQMLREVLIRRFKNNWPKPDLMLIDGGRGQLNIALAVTSQFKIKTDVVSLAKRFEQIYIGTKLLPIALNRENPARLLVAEIRDEAHRFAISYHRLLRSKRLLTGEK